MGGGGGGGGGREDISILLAKLHNYDYYLKHLASILQEVAAFGNNFVEKLGAPVLV